MISSAMAHAVALFKNHLPDLDVGILHKDLVIDDTVHETLVSRDTMPLKTLCLHMTYQSHRVRRQ
jgi:hypothetical protein